MHLLDQLLGSLGGFAPIAAVLLFLLAGLLIMWRLERLAGQGVEGTVLGTLFMPYCSGLGNILFALILARRGGSGEDVAVNCFFNNVTNLTLLVALPVLIRGMSGIPRRKNRAAVRDHHIGRLAIALNLAAAFFFSLFTFLLVADDAVLSRSDGFILLALFLFWQIFHLYDVKKTNLLQKKRYPPTLPLEILLLLVGAFGVYLSTDWLVAWFQQLDPARVSPRLLGWLSGVLMVLPNAFLAFYYGARDRMDVVYTSQAGDAHICIPFSLGLFAVFRPVVAGPFFRDALFLLMGIYLIHLALIVLLGRLPRFAAALFLLVFGLFLWLGRTAG